MPGLLHDLPRWLLAPVPLALMQPILGHIGAHAAPWCGDRSAGRMSLALSARCYHARAYGRARDSCQFVCKNDPDGLQLRTIDGRSFLSSHDYLNLIQELPDLQASGVSRFRLSPHTCVWWCPGLSPTVSIVGSQVIAGPSLSDGSLVPFR